ncbi:hypothetical protein AU253_11455 [Yersinia pestis]|nr:hypothetical protein AU253_11455 [Yersinia pestis]
MYISFFKFALIRVIVWARLFSNSHEKVAMMKRGLFEKAGRAVLVLTVCLICIKPMVTTVQNESWAVKDQRSFSIFSITFNKGLF